MVLKSAAEPEGAFRSGTDVPSRRMYLLSCGRGQKRHSSTVYRPDAQAKSPEEVIECFRKEGFGIGSNKAFMYARCLLKGRIILVSEGLTKRGGKCISIKYRDISPHYNNLLRTKYNLPFAFLPLSRQYQAFLSSPHQNADRIPHDQAPHRHP